MHSIESVSFSKRSADTSDVFMHAYKIEKERVRVVHIMRIYFQGLPYFQFDAGFLSCQIHERK